jgi:AcrR family transcriptional regulator
VLVGILAVQASVRNSRLGAVEKAMKKSTETLRKSPKQERSKELVQAIYEATVRILPEVGPDNVTTKKIAEVAGISIGSLYQYFPNKESVLGAVMDVSSQIINSTLLKRFNEIPAMELDEAIQFAVDSAMDLMLTERRQLREVYRNVNELGRTQAMLSFRRVAVDQLASELNRRYPSIPKKECERISFLTVNCLMGIVLTMLYDETQEWTRDELKAELGHMFKLYVRERISRA